MKFVPSLQYKLAATFSSKGTNDWRWLMTEITLVGLGPMGSALGNALLSKGHTLTVWNRTASKADALVAAGAIRKESVTDAVEASPLIVVCLAGYDAMHDVFEGQADMLAGRTIVSLSSGTPQEARETRSWAALHEIAFLAGAIMVPPSMVGRPEALFFYSGDQAVFDVNLHALRSVGGDARYLGEDAALALLYNTSLLGLYWSTIAGFLHAAALVGSAGVRAETFAPVAQEFLSVPRDIMAYCAGQIDAGHYPGDAGRLAMDAIAMDHLRKASEAQGVGTRVPDFLRRLAQDAIGKGHRDDSLTSVIEIIKQETEDA
jgi:3-hydroxyisobutyrate dehydrogenase-like beta-hydroxyacid dehydrogenase